MSNGMCRQTEVVLTVSHGEFEDRGKLGIGTHGREVSATCQGRHVVSMRKDVREHLFLWRAPSLLTSDSIGSSNGTAALSSGTSVTFNATLACHEYGAFRRAPMLSVTAGAALPDSNRSSCQTHEGTSAEHGGGSEHAVLTTDVPPPHSHGGFDALTLLHAWLAAAAFAVFFPFSAGFARYAKPPPQTGGQSAWSSWCINRIGDSWFKLHRAAALFGAACASVSLLLMLVHKFAGGHSHLQSWHAKLGLAAFILAVVQPILGILRPPKGPGTNQCRRRAWYVAHVVCAGSLLGAGTFAVVTGVQKAKPHDVAGAEVYESMLYVWLAALCAAALLFEIMRARCDGFVTRMSSSMAGTPMSLPTAYEKIFVYR